MWCENAQPARFCVSQNSEQRAWRDPERCGGGYIHTPNSPCSGADRHTQLTYPHAFQGCPDARVKPYRLYWDSACAQQARRGWDRVTAREPQVTRVCGSDLGGLCSACPGGRGWPGSGALPPLPASPCLCAWGTEGLQGGSVALEGMSGQQALVLCPRLRICNSNSKPPRSPH